MLCAIWAATALPAHAQSPLRQAGIEVDATAADAVQARERAHAQARRTGLERLARAVGAAPPALSDAQIDALVASLIVEQERVTPTRYAARLTVVFNGAAARTALGPGVPLEGGGDRPPPNPLAGTPARDFVTAAASFGSLGEWLELRRRLLAAGPVASVDIIAISVSDARLRLGLRMAPAVAAEQLGPGLELRPGGAPGDPWQVGLAPG